MTKLLFVIILTPFLLKGQTQKERTDSLRRDSVRRHYLEMRKAFSDEYLATIKDSIEFVGQLLDMNFGTSCGTEPGAGIFIFKVTSVGRSNFPDTIGVVIQCAIGQYERLLTKGVLFALKVTPDKLRYWIDFEWEKYKLVPRYFIMRKPPKRVDE